MTLLCFRIENTQHSPYYPSIRQSHIYKSATHTYQVDFYVNFDTERNKAHKLPTVDQGQGEECVCSACVIGYVDWYRLVLVSLLLLLEYGESVVGVQSGIIRATIITSWFNHVRRLVRVKSLATCVINLAISISCFNIHKVRNIFKVILSLQTVTGGVNFHVFKNKNLRVSANQKTTLQSNEKHIHWSNEIRIFLTGSTSCLSDNNAI